MDENKPPKSKAPPVKKEAEKKPKIENRRGGVEQKVILSVARL